MMACEKVFLQRLRERGLRLKPQREMVLAVMHELESLAAAEKVYERVCSRPWRSTSPPCWASRSMRQRHLPGSLRRDTALVDVGHLFVEGLCRECAERLREAVRDN